jgi:hypothetical protein
LAFSIGQSRTLVPTTSGTLFLAFNDGADFQDNAGSWNVNVTFEELVRLAPPTAYGSDWIYADRITTSLVDNWGVILTVQEGQTDPAVVWNSVAVANLEAAFSAIQIRLLNRTNRTFKQVFGGLELRFCGPFTGNPTPASQTYNENLIRFSPITRTVGPTFRIDNRAWSRITPLPEFDFYPPRTPVAYGFYNPNDRGIQSTVMHELGHVLKFRSASIVAAATQFGLRVMKDTNSPNVDSTLDIGTFWENPSIVFDEKVADNFLNWVYDSYVGIEHTIDTYPTTGTEQQRASAFWIGRQFNLPPSEGGGGVTSSGIAGFTNQWC